MESPSLHAPPCRLNRELESWGQDTPPLIAVPNLDRRVGRRRPSLVASIWRTMGTMRFSCWLALLVAGCGSAPPHSLDALANKQLLVIVDFNPPKPPPSPGVLATLQFDYRSTPCPLLDVSADLDGVALEASSNLTGSVGNACQLAFYLTAAPPLAAPQSTLRFRDQSGDAALSATRLLDARTLTTTLADGSVVHVGDTIDFAWSTDTDRIDAVEGSLVSGASRQQVVPQ